MENKARSEPLWWAVSIVLWISLGISLATVVATWSFYWQQQENRPVAVTTTPEALKEKLDAYDKRADELEKLISLLLGLSTIYAIALGLSAYQQLKDSADKLENLTKEARSKIDKLPKDLDGIKAKAQHVMERVADKADKDMEDFERRVRDRYPMFADMDQAIRSIMNRLMYLLPVIDPASIKFKAIISQVKEEIFFYEKTVAALECFNLRAVPGLVQTASEIYHGLGNFYGLKYKDEAKSDDETKPDASTKERSRFYLMRAISYDDQNTGALNDLAFFALSIEGNPDLALARKYLEESLAIDADQQRAAYDLAWIEQDEKNFPAAEDLLSKALEMKKWQRGPARNLGSIRYNRACARARQAQAELDPIQRENWANKALADLEETFAVPQRPYNPETVICFLKDIQADGDLILLASDERWKGQITQLAARVSS